MKPTHRAVLFDLDGTLADTLADLANATNHALTQLGCPTHPVEKYRYMVGDGARNLLLRALPAHRQELAEEGVRLMKSHYAEHCFDQTRLYPGIPELITALVTRGDKLAVLSNKPDEFTKRMVAHYFPSAVNVGATTTSRPSADLAPARPRRGSRSHIQSHIQSHTHPDAIGPFEAVCGQLPDVPLKPDPTAALQIATTLGIPPAEWLYLGDTNTDMRTARAAGMCPVGVLWGFREREELVESGAEFLAQTPGDVLHLP